MKKQEYLKRLKGMLENRRDPCGCCPTGKYYCWGVVSYTYIRGGNEGCEWCKKLLVKGKRKDSLGLVLHSDARNCPCVVLGSEVAVARAWKLLAEEGLV